jgi:predicted enzyme related to lactoylglutathione lyase
MSQRDEYPAGVPCKVVALQRDPQAGSEFYGALFGWDVTSPDPSPEGEMSGPFTARLRGRQVAEIAPAPEGVAATWMTHVRVADAHAVTPAVEAAGGTVIAGPLDLSPSGRVVVLADPTGAGLCAWEAGEHEGAQLVNEPGAWAMSVLETAGSEEAITFYRSVFGWEDEPFGPPEGQVTLFRRPGYVGGEPEQPVPRDVVAALAPGEPGAARWAVDFWVADADATARRASELGGQVMEAPQDTPGFRRAVLADREGAVFSVSQLMLG